MLYLYYKELAHLWSPLNVLRYVSFRTMASFALSLFITMLFYPKFINMLRKNKVGQVVRDDGPKQHYSKEGTPTMGGVLILLSIVLSTLLLGDLSNHLVLFTLLNGIIFGAVGFIDDYKKVKEKDYHGLSGKVRLLIEFLSVIGLFLWFYFTAANYYNWNLNLYIPFVSAKKFWIPLPLAVYVILAALVVVGTANASNLTDGMDGLAAGVLIIGAGVLTILAYLTGLKIGNFELSKYLMIPTVEGASELAIISSAVMGGTIGFLYYNTYPASVFMGDTGALGLGAILGSISLLTKNELLSVIIFGILVLEAVSVIAQTTYYKLTHKRLIKMAPVHYTFLLLGWDEPKIVVRAWIISIILALIALSSIKVR